MQKLILGLALALLFPACKMRIWSQVSGTVYPPVVANPNDSTSTMTGVDRTATTIGTDSGNEDYSKTRNTLPDAPSATKQTTCTEKNGKPCPGWVHKLIGQYPPVDLQETWNGRSDRFFTIGSGRRMLHPDKKSWAIFIAGHAAMWAATAVALNNPRSRETAHSEIPAVAFLTGIDLLVFKTISPAISTAPTVYGTIHYARSATR